jgi:hypothetical protein
VTQGFQPRLDNAQRGSELSGGRCVATSPAVPFRKMRVQRREIHGTEACYRTGCRCVHSQVARQSLRDRMEFARVRQPPNPAQLQRRAEYLAEKWADVPEDEQRSWIISLWVRELEMSGKGM